MGALLKPDRLMKRSIIHRSLLTLSLALLLGSVAGPTSAEDQAALVRLLRNSEDFRVRVQAAFALGRLADARSEPALENALRDTAPAVRAAAADALGRLHQPTAITALQQALNDPSAAVRQQAGRAIEQLMALDEAQAVTLPVMLSQPAATSHADLDNARYVVMVGSIENRSGYLGSAMATRMRYEVEQNLKRIQGVAAIDNSHGITAELSNELTRRRLPVMRLDGNLTRVRTEARAPAISVRCEVSLLLMEEPERIMRSMMNGAATGTDELRRSDNRQQVHLAEQALAGAVRSALSNASRAFSQALAQN